MANVILRVKREDGTWAEIPALVGPEGPQGVSIDDIVLKSQEGGVSTYLILLSDGSEKTFQVTDGAIITDVSLISTDVLIDTYKISISDGSFFNFKVTNGRGIKSIAKTSTDVLSDTYTISYNDNTSSTFKVTNGRSITKIVKSKTDVLTDTYTISYNDNTTSTYTITNGRGIDYIEKDETIGLSDRYTIHYNDGSTSYYHVVNGEAGPAGSIGNRIYLSGLVDKVNDEEGYGRVKELKESDFDLSKFTVVGSPVISEDGIASGFSASDYLIISNLGDITTKPFKFYFNIKKLGSWAEGHPPYPYGYENSFFYVLANDHGFQVHVYVNNNGAKEDKVIGTLYTPAQNSKRSYCLEWNGSNTYTVTPLDESQNPITLTSEYPPYINAQRVGQTSLNCEVDLKEIRCVVDGVEVFSGNPTVLDTIKANNYIVGGSPTITDDGMFKANASGDSVSKYDFTNEIKKELRCDGRFYYSTKTNNTGNVIQLANGSTVYWDINNDGLVTLTDDINVSTVQIEIPLKDGYIFDTEIIYNASTITLNVCLNEGVNYTTSIASQGLTTFNSWILSPFNYWGGTVDLNTIHVYIDGNLVYQPCLKIPYTKAKTGSKIVDAAYKLRVEDCYNQYGAGNYYLFSSATEQFALPMPDIYGLLQSAIEDLDNKIVNLDNKKVNRAGDMMTGPLTIRGPEHPQLSIYRTNPANDTPNEEKAAQLLFLGSDDKWIGAVQNVNYAGSATVDGVTTNYPVNVTGLESRTLQNNGTSYLQEGLWVATDSQGNAWTYGPHPANKLDNSNKLATTNWVRNHCCTTPATTESTASLDAPCYVIENYVNGTSWYRLWSDTFIEQGNYPVSNPINLPHPYKNNNYIVTLGLMRLGAAGDYAIQYIYAKSSSSFQIRHAWNGGSNFSNQNMYYAFGY